MTREVAIKRLNIWLKCVNCPEDKQCYDSYLHTICEDYDYGEEVSVEEAVKIAIQALEQTRWIPVSEKLPEVNQRVLVTSYGRVCYAMMTSADGNSGYPIFRLQDSLNEKVVCETTVHSKFTTSRITAWMPLPPCYEPQESEESE